MLFKINELREITYKQGVRILELEKIVYELEAQLEDVGQSYLEEIQEHELAEAWLEDKVALLTTENAFLEKENAELTKQVEALEYRYNRLIEVVGKLINK